MLLTMILGLPTNASELHWAPRHILRLCDRSFMGMIRVTESTVKPQVLLELFVQGGDKLEGLKKINAFLKELHVSVVYACVKTKQWEKNKQVAHFSNKVSTSASGTIRIYTKSIGLEKFL